MNSVVLWMKVSLIGFGNFKFKELCALLPRTAFTCVCQGDMNAIDFITRLCYRE